MLLGNLWICSNSQYMLVICTSNIIKSMFKSLFWGYIKHLANTQKSNDESKQHLYVHLIYPVDLRYYNSADLPLKVSTRIIDVYFFLHYPSKTIMNNVCVFFTLTWARVHILVDCRQRINMQMHMNFVVSWNICPRRHYEF